MRKFYLLVLMSAVVVLITGCSKAPVTEMSSADQAMASATQAQAQKYAAAEWQMAQDTLEAAKAEQTKQDGRFSLFRSYGHSRSLALRGAELAMQAQAAAKKRVDELRAETQLLLDQVETDLTTTEQAVATAPVAKGTRSEIELMKQDVLALRTLYDGAKADLARSDFETAQSKARNIVNRCTEIRAAIDAAKAKKGKSG